MRTILRRSPLATLAIPLALVAFPLPTSAQDPIDIEFDDQALGAAAANAYEHLATSLIEMRAAEDALVAVILTHYKDMAIASMRAGEMTKAAMAISFIANEGDKKVQAVRQRLEKAGHHHHHHADAETEEDYIFVDGKEKKDLLSVAGKVGKAKADEATGLIFMLETLFKNVMKPE
jgi:hypothetical protein